MSSYTARGKRSLKTNPHKKYNKARNISKAKSINSTISKMSLLEEFFFEKLITEEPFIKTIMDDGADIVEVTHNWLKVLNKKLELGLPDKYVVMVLDRVITIVNNYTNK